MYYICFENMVIPFFVQPERGERDIQQTDFLPRILINVILYNPLAWFLTMFIERDV